MKGPVTVPQEFVFMDARHRLGGVFLHLDCRLNFYRMFNEAIENFSLRPSPRGRSRRWTASAFPSRHDSQRTVLSASLIFGQSFVPLTARSPVATSRQRMPTTACRFAPAMVLPARVAWRRRARDRDLHADAAIRSVLPVAVTSRSDSPTELEPAVLARSTTLPAMAASPPP